MCAMRERDLKFNTIIEVSFFWFAATTANLIDWNASSALGLLASLFSSDSLKLSSTEINILFVCFI